MFRQAKLFSLDLRENVNIFLYLLLRMLLLCFTYNSETEEKDNKESFSPTNIIVLPSHYYMLNIITTFESKRKRQTFIFLYQV